MLEPELPPGVGRHEGREFDLMRAGQKDVALFIELKPDGLDQALADGFLLLEFEKQWADGPIISFWIVYRAGHAAKASRLQALVLAPSRGFYPSTEHEIGKILGYTKDEVNAFLAHVGS